jgi:SH3-like domain-containing protein
LTFRNTRHGIERTTLCVAAVMLMLVAIPSTADPIVPGVEHCVVNVRSDDVLNVRTAPSSASPVAAKKRHDSCGILVQRACKGNWCRVEDGHSLGWAHRHYLAMVSPSRYCVSNVAAGDALNLRAFPSTQSRITARLSRNQCGIAFLPYAIRQWQKIRVNGWQGWVNRQFLSGQ